MSSRPRVDRPAAAPPADPSVPSAADSAVPPAAAFLTRLFPEPREFAIRLWDDTVLPAAAEPRFTLIISSSAALRAMFRPPVERSLVNAFISGALEVAGDLTAALPVIDACRRAVRSPGALLALAGLWRRLPRGAAPIAGAAAPAPLSGRRHSPERDSRAIRFHYDLGNDFYSLFLDSRMIYSCGYFPTGTEDLDTAQLLKLDYICRKLRLRAGERMLDVGCGWGGLLIHAARQYGVTAVGITLSERQHELARQRIAEAGLADRIEVRLADYRTLGAETFDKAASIGMFEHVGGAQLPEYFARIRSAVRPGGLFLNHGISHHAIQPYRGLRSMLLDPLNRLLVGTSPLKSAVFPDSELRPLSEINMVAERAYWEIRDVENLREHYATTLRHWIANMREHEAEAVRIVGRATYRAWLLYFAGNAALFDNGRITLNQTLFARLDERGRAHVPPSRADLYR